MKNASAVIKRLLKDESGQGATEYVLLVVVVVALVLLFRNKITAALEGKLESLSNSIGEFTGSPSGQ